MKTTLVTFLLSAFCHAHAAEPEIDFIAARVNGAIIRFSALRAESEPYTPALREKFRGKELVDAIIAKKKAVLEQMIDRTLLLQELTRRGIPLENAVTDEKIDAAIKERFHSDRQQWLKRLKPKAVIEKHFFEHR